MHATMAKCLSILGYGKGEIIRIASTIKAAMIVYKGKLRNARLITIIAAAGVVTPTKKSCLLI